MSKYEFFAADCEATGLIYEMSKDENRKLHNFCLMPIIQDSDETETFELLHPHKPEDFIKLQNKIDDKNVVLIMHNAYDFDLRCLELFGYDISKIKVVDTLILSYYMYPSRKIHGLDSWGRELGVLKPKVDDWKNLTQEEYDHRVIEDCKIQRLVWMKLCNDFAELYELDTQDQVFDHPAFKYLMFKAKQLKEQADNKFLIDIDGAEKLRSQLAEEIGKRITELESAMPKVPKKAKKRKPKEPYLKNGNLSVAGRKWHDICEQHGYDFDFQGEIEVITGYKEPNANSTPQIKEWLYSLGWQPETFEFDRDKETGEVRKIPQINLKQSGGLVCPSVERLIEDAPELEALKGLGILNHRKSMLDGWIENNEDGYIPAEASGFTNTLRLKHRKLVNLPSGRVPYGLEIRALMKARDGYVLTGSDLSSLENRWKFDYQYPLDPEYVKNQMSDDFDPHLALGEMAGLIKPYESDFYKWFDANYDTKEDSLRSECDLDHYRHMQLPELKTHFSRIKKLRGTAKNGNYACLPMDAKIVVKDGVKSFDQIQVGDKVMSINSKYQHVETEVLHKHFYKDAELYTYKLLGLPFEIECTRNHRWLANNGDWMTLQEIMEKGLRVYLGNDFAYRVVRETLKLGLHDVYCLTTTEGSFFVKYKDYVMLTGNCQYGSGAETLARTAKITLEQAKQLKEGYDKLNWTIPKIARSQFVKTFSMGKFLLNKKNKIWYPLKAEKDRFSTLIQGSGSYTLDLWILKLYGLRKKYIEEGKIDELRLLATFHDEMVLEHKPEYCDVVKQMLLEALDQVNQNLKLAVPVGCDIKHGATYADIH